MHDKMIAFHYAHIRISKIKRHEEIPQGKMFNPNL